MTYFVQQRPRWNRGMAMEALANGAELRLEIRLGGGWFMCKPGQKPGEETRFPIGIAERLLRDNLIELKDAGSGVYGFAPEGKDWYAKNG